MRDEKKYTPEYAAWQNMIYRCTRPQHRIYPLYGGKGIKVCDRWLHSFDEFLKDVGRRPPHARWLARIDTLGNYEPGNVKWMSPAMALSRKQRRLFTWNGITQSAKDWAEDLDLNLSTFYERVRMWDLDRALTEPAQVNKRRS